ncbi:MAG: tetratricopeptide repeat protein, partial [Chthoniobacterales bacterium]|nr:tetratricopeptide repeat protein [Chthoniobacterales bacterium]
MGTQQAGRPERFGIPCARHWRLRERCVNSTAMRILRALFAFALLVIITLALGELVLRISAWGGDPRWIREVGQLSSGETLCIVDPEAANSLVAGQQPSNAPRVMRSSFVMPKPRDTLRIFLVGDSAAKGDPQPRNLAVSSFLQAMLSDALPGKKIEVINLGASGVSSAVLTGQVRDAIRFSPDLFIFYAGNNEFFGLGGCVERSSASGLRRALQRSAFVCWLESRASTGRAVQQAPIPADSPLREAAARSLSFNLGRMLDEVKAADVPAIVCTTAGNESGLAPLGQDHIGGLDARQQGELKRLMDEAVEVADRENHAQAVNLLRQAVQLAPRSAKARFLLGKVLVAAGQNDPARVAFLEARDLDTLPLRPISLTEQAIRNTALVKGAVFCDMAEIFRRESPDGATGWDLLDDHVHLSLSGQARAARSMVGAMANLAPPLQLDPGQLALVREDAAYAEDLGTNIYDTYAVNCAQRALFASPQMKETNGEAFKVFDELCREQEEEMEPSVLAAVRDWQARRSGSGTAEPITAAVAQVLTRDGAQEQALDLWELSARQVPEYTLQFLEYVYFALACRQKLDGELTPDAVALSARAIAQGNFILARDLADDAPARRYIGGLHQLRGEWAEAIPFLVAARNQLAGKDRLAADQALVLSYLKTDKRDQALAVADEGIKKGGEDAGFYRALRWEVE